MTGKWVTFWLSAAGLLVAVIGVMMTLQIVGMWDVLPQWLCDLLPGGSECQR